MVMTSYVCGSFCYTGDIKIYIFKNPSKFPFQSHTCSKELHVFITPTKQNAFNWVLKQNRNNKNNNFSPIEKLYNIFLDRTTQIA
jgi:ribosomal protein L24E